MNEMKPLETLLRSWAPRRPSARLNRRLFASHLAAGNHQSPISDHPPPTLRLVWLAPAAACLVLVCALLSQRNSAGSSTPTSTGSMVAMILSNQSYAAYVPGSFQPEQNALRNTFEWTNRSQSTSSMGFVSPIKAND